MQEKIFSGKFAKSNGFTFLEVIIVISLIGILAAAAFPRLSGHMSRYYLDSAARTLVSDIRSVQQLSINAGYDITASYCLQFYNQYYYAIIDEAAMAILKTVYLPETVRWRNTPNAIRFNPIGAPRTNSSQTIELITTTGSQTLFIKIAPVTGRVRYTSVSASGNQ